jgi:membrane protease subunit (stomatin/prohibitin family)
MGLIKSAASAIGSTMHDQWKEAIRCEDLGNEILMMKKTTPTGVITNKSTIIVAPGQCAIIYDNGKVIDATAEEGIYEFDSSSSPSFFAGQFGDVFKEMWQRFTYDGATSKQQAVFFFNIKEIMDNKFGTPAPIPFQDWSHAIPNQMTGEKIPLRVEIKCFGKYTFKISNPALFMSEIAGVADVYKKEDVVEQIRTEVMAVFQNVTNELGNSKYKVPVLEMPSYTDEIKQMMDVAVYDENTKRRGLTITGFSVESVTLTEESEKKIDEYELSANSYMQQGRLVGAYADATQKAAENANGAANGFMGIGMMNMASGNVVGGATTGPWANNPQPVTQQNQQNPTQSTTAQAQVNGKTEEKWVCECGVENPGKFKFCGACGKKRPENN